MSKPSGNLISKGISAGTVNEENSNDRPSTSKSLVRNCEITVHPTVNSNDIPSTSQTKTDKENVDNVTLSEPKPFSCIKIADYMKIINDLGCRKVKVPTGRGKLPKGKGLKKINIPIDEQVYKGLIDLEVREEDLGINVAQIKPKEFTKQKDVEPLLSDYYKPSFNQEYIVKQYPLEFELSKLWVFKGNSISNSIKRWESDAQQ